MKPAKPRTLIVDPDTSYQEIMRDLLSHKMVLDQVNSAKEALEKCWEYDYDLIITEMKLPDMDALDFMEKVKRKMLNTLIVVITESDSVEDATNAIKKGAIDFIHKPFSIEQIALLMEKFYSLSLNREYDYDFLELLTEERRTFELPTDFGMVNPFLNDIISMLKRFPEISSRSLLAIRISIYEMLMNALEHGNLEIDYKEKQALLEKITDYHKYLNEKASAPPYSDRKVWVSYHYTTEYIEFTVEDEGKGFNPESIPNPTKQTAHVPINGRGIFITRLNMDEVQYNEKGNKVTMKHFFKKGTK